ncbi:MAG: hypothetical protein IJ234_00050 [Clostridia bacterium]|nr:hypothetical protein [Clostridia bacterium]
MLRFLSVLMIVLLIVFPCAFASDLGVQVIGGDYSIDIASLDDVQLGNSYEIPNYAKFNPQTFTFVDSFAEYGQGYNGDNTTSNSTGTGTKYVYTSKSSSKYLTKMFWNDSGASAEYAWLVMDITNLSRDNVDFLSDSDVKVIYQEEYEFAGWVRQFNFDYNQRVYRHAYDYVAAPTAVLNPEAPESIPMLYTGNYVFGCTLPNAVVEDKAGSLKMVITINGNEITYAIRK